jgi:hypothetical protein
MYLPSFRDIVVTGSGGSGSLESRRCVPQTAPVYWQERRASSEVPALVTWAWPSTALTTGVRRAAGTSPCGRPRTAIRRSPGGITRGRLRAAPLFPRGPESPVGAMSKRGRPSPRDHSHPEPVTGSAPSPVCTDGGRESGSPFQRKLASRGVAQPGRLLADSRRNTECLDHRGFHAGVQPGDLAGGVRAAGPRDAEKLLVAESLAALDDPHRLSARGPLARAYGAWSHSHPAATQQLTR